MPKITSEEIEQIMTDKENQPPQYDDIEDLLNQRELFDACTQANPDIFSTPSLGEMERIARLLKRKRREFYASMIGVDIILDDGLPDNYWCIHTGKQVYDDIMQEVRDEPKH